MRPLHILLLSLVKKVASSELGKKCAQIKLCLHVKNSPEQFKVQTKVLVDFDVKRVTWDVLFHWRKQCYYG